MPWVAEVAIPFTPRGTVFLSTVIGNDVYAIDQGYNLQKYDIDGDSWTALTGPSYSVDTAALPWTVRTLALSPDGTKFAIVSQGAKYWGGTQDVQRCGGGLRVEIYNIAGDSWSASKEIDFTISTYPAYAQALAWADEDTLWVWCVQGYSTVAVGNERIFIGKCAKYTISTDTWASYTNTFYIFSRVTATQVWQALSRGAAIKDDGSVVYLGPSRGNEYQWEKYTIATDAYSIGGALNTLADEFCYAYDSNKLWFFDAGDTCRQGYVSAEDDSENVDRFPENTTRDTGYGSIIGVREDASLIIAVAKSSAPELMSWEPIGAFSQVHIIG